VRWPSSLVGAILGRLLEEIEFGHVPVLTVLVRKWTRADDRDAEAVARLLTREQLAEQLAAVALLRRRDAWARAVQAEALRRGL